MARITIEDCLGNVENMYELVHLATKRARQIFHGSSPTVRCKNKPAVTALREIAEGNVLPINRQATAADDDDLSELTN